MIYHDKTYANCRIAFEGNTFVSCRFGAGCVIVFSGVGWGSVQGCEFDLDGIKFDFVGPAGQTLAFIRDMSKLPNGEHFLARMIEALQA